MVRVLFTSSRHPGYVLPLLEVARAMTARGDEVWFLTGDRFRERIEAAGARFLRLPYDDRVSGERPADAGALRGRRQIDHLLRTVFLEPVETDFRTVLAHVDALGIDLVVTEPLFVGSTIIGLLPRQSRPAVLSVNLSPLPLSGPEVAPFGAGLTPIDEPLNTLRNTVLGLGVDLLLSGGVRRAFHRQVRRLTGRQVRGPLLDLALTADVLAQTTVPAFEYPRRSLPESVRFVGPVDLDLPIPLPAWWDYRDRRPIVHVTQGTYANDDPTELIVPTILALADEDVLVVATTGGPDPSAVTAALGGTLPANTRVERFLPYDHLLPAAHVMVTNGGFGAVHQALRRGLPLVVAGATEDRPEVNARVAWSGAGVDLRTNRPTPAEVRRAVLAVLGEHGGHRAAADRLAAAIAGTDAVGALLGIADELTSVAPGGVSGGSSGPRRPSARRAGATPSAPPR